MTAPLRSELHPLYRHLLPDLFDRPAVPESRATCDDCPMCDKGTSAAANGAHTYLADTKCCTYHPTLPNFLVGALLRDTSSEHAEGRRRVRAKIEQRVGVTPRWLSVPRKTAVMFEASRQRSFGQSKALLCPYHDAGRCTLWRFRESVCATYFCRHDAGASGAAFWGALKEYLSHVELVLSGWAVRAIDPNMTEPTVPPLQLTPEDLEDRPPCDADYGRFWSGWVGREEAFYIDTTQRIEQLDAERFRALVDGTPRAAELLGKLRERHVALISPGPVKHLVLNRRLSAVPTAGGAMLTSYSPSDPIFISNGLAHMLGSLQKDEPFAEALVRLQEEHAVEIPEELVLKLRAFDVLVPPDEEADGAAPAQKK